MAELLKIVGTLVPIDQNILLLLKGKFTRACLNINITSPLLGRLTISWDGRSRRVLLIYEVLDEVYPILWW